MVHKDCKILTNEELKLHKLNLTNEYEAIKAQMAELENKLDEIDREYVKVENEERIRRTTY